MLRIFEFCNAQKISKNKEWRAAGRQCSGAHPVLPRGGNRRWGKMHKKLYNQEVEICIKTCKTRRWKYPELRVWQGVEPLLLLSLVRGRVVSQWFSGSKPHTGRWQIPWVPLCFWVLAVNHHLVSPGLLLACGILVKLHIPRRSGGNCGGYDGAWLFMCNS